MNRYELTVTVEDSVARIQLLYCYFSDKGPDVLNSLAPIVHTFTAMALYATTMESNYSHFPHDLKVRKVPLRQVFASNSHFVEQAPFACFSELYNIKFFKSKVNYYLFPISPHHLLFHISHLNFIAITTVTLYLEYCIR